VTKASHIGCFDVNTGVLMACTNRTGLIDASEIVVFYCMDFEMPADKIMHKE
jgi:hypothetical protein